MLSSSEIYENYLKVPINNRHITLRNAAKKWASSNFIIYEETINTPIQEFDRGFLYYLTNVKPNNHYESVYIAMRDYFKYTKNSGSKYFLKA